MRERDVPRRQLWGDYVEDQMLDHSDSFRTIQTEDIGDESINIPDKSIVDSVAGDKEDGVEDELTPRKKDESLELEQSPESKFSIQMSPAKGEEI